MACNFNCSDCASKCTQQEPQIEKSDLVKKLESLIPNAEEDFLYDELYHSRPYRVLLGVTSDCNLRCPYCFTHRQSERMTLEAAILSLELTLKNYNESKDPRKDRKPTVTFFGGEPMLEYESIIKPLINKYQDTFDWSMTTNGVLLDEDTVDFLWQNKVQLLLSFDGVREVQDNQRPGAGFSSYDKVMNNIPYLLVRYPELAVRSTLTRKMIPHLYETHCMFEEMGFRRWYCGVNAFEEWSPEDYKLAQKEAHKIGAHILDKTLRPDDYPLLLFEPLNRLIRDFHSVRKGHNYFDNGVMRCGMGTTTFSVTPDGRIVPCQEEITTPRNIIGSVYEGGINPELHQKYLEYYVSRVQEARDIVIRSGLNHFSISQRVVCPSRLLQNDFKKEPTDVLYNEILMAVANKLYYLTRGSIIPNVLNLTAERFEENIDQELVVIPKKDDAEEKE